MRQNLVNNQYSHVIPHVYYANPIICCSIDGDVIMVTMCCVYYLIHGVRDTMALILQTTFTNAFHPTAILVGFIIFRLKYHSKLLPKCLFDNESALV